MSSFLQGPLGSPKAFQSFLEWRRDRATSANAKPPQGIDQQDPLPSAPVEERVDLLLELSASRDELLADNSHPRYVQYQILQRLNGRLLGQTRLFDWVSVPVAVVERLQRDSDERLILQEYAIVRVWLDLPLVPQSAIQDAHSPLTRQDNLHALKEMGIENSKDLDGLGVKWALVDSRVCSRHPFLHDLQMDQWKLLRPEVGVAQVVGDQDSPDFPFKSHGTQMAGLIHTVAPAAHVVSVALTASDDESTTGTRGELEFVLEWLADQVDIRGVSLSLGLPGDATKEIPGKGPGIEGIEACSRAGKIVVVAAGNHTDDYCGLLNNQTDRSVQYLATAHAALVTGACDSLDPVTWGVCAFSCHGPTPDGREKPDFVAPGADIASCGNFIGARAKSYENGTSHATALVSGSCALILSRLPPSTGDVPRPTPAALRDALRKTARDLQRSASDQRSASYQGAGIVQIEQADKELRKTWPN